MKNTDAVGSLLFLILILFIIFGLPRVYQVMEITGCNFIVACWWVVFEGV